MAKIVIEIDSNGKSCGACSIRKVWPKNDFVQYDIAFCPAFDLKELTWGDGEYPIRLHECIAAEVKEC